MNRVEQAICRIREKLPNNQGFVTLGCGCVVRNDELTESLGWKCPNILVTTSSVLSPELLALDRTFVAEFLVREKKGFEVFDLKLAAEYCRVVRGREITDISLSANEQNQPANEPPLLEAGLTIISVEPLDKRGFLKRMVKKSTLQTTRPLTCSKFQNSDFLSEISESFFCNVVRDVGSNGHEFETRTYRFGRNEDTGEFVLKDFAGPNIPLDLRNFPDDQQPLGAVIFSKHGEFAGCIGYYGDRLVPFFVPDQIHRETESAEQVNNNISAVETSEEECKEAKEELPQEVDDVLTEQAELKSCEEQDQLYPHEPQLELVNNGDESLNKSEDDLVVRISVDHEENEHEEEFLESKEMESSESKVIEEEHGPREFQETQYVEASHTQGGSNEYQSEISATTESRNQENESPSTSAAETPGINDEVFTTQQPEGSPPLEISITESEENTAIDDDMGNMEERREESKDENIEEIINLGFTTQEKQQPDSAPTESGITESDENAAIDDTMGNMEEGRVENKDENIEEINHVVFTTQEKQQPEGASISEVVIKESAENTAITDTMGNMEEGRVESKDDNIEEINNEVFTSQEEQKPEATSTYEIGIKESAENSGIDGIVDKMEESKEESKDANIEEINNKDFTTQEIQKPQGTPTSDSDITKSEENAATDDTMENIMVQESREESTDANIDEVCEHTESKDAEIEDNVEEKEVEIVEQNEADNLLENKEKEEERADVNEEVIAVGGTEESVVENTINNAENNEKIIVPGDNTEITEGIIGSGGNEIIPDIGVSKEVRLAESDNMPLEITYERTCEIPVKVEIDIDLGELATSKTETLEDNIDDSENDILTNTTESSEIRLFDTESESPQIAVDQTISETPVEGKFKIDTGLDHASATEEEAEDEIKEELETKNAEMENAEVLLAKSEEISPHITYGQTSDESPGNDPVEASVELHVDTTTEVESEQKENSNGEKEEMVDERNTVEQTDFESHETTRDTVEQVSDDVADDFQGLVNEGSVTEADVQEIVGHNKGIPEEQICNHFDEVESIHLDNEREEEMEPDQVKQTERAAIENGAEENKDIVEVNEESKAGLIEEDTFISTPEVIKVQEYTEVHQEKIESSIHVGTSEPLVETMTQDASKEVMIEDKLDTSGNETGLPLQPDDLLSDAVTNNPKVLEDLAKCLDTEYQYGVIPCWRDLGEVLAIPPEAYEHCSSFSDTSPTEDLLMFLSATKPQLTVSDVKDSLRAIGRTDVVQILERGITRSVISNDSVVGSLVERDDTDLLGRVAIKLDPGYARNWKALAIQLEIPRRVFRNFGSHQRQNSALLLFKYLPIFNPDLTIKAVRDACEAIGRFDAVKALDSSGIPGDDPIKDILDDADFMDELTDYLNEEGVPCWRQLAKELGIPDDKCTIFEPAGRNSPTVMLLRSIEKCEPDVTVEELVLALVAMKRQDVIEMLGKHFKREDIRSILEENNCLPPEPVKEETTEELSSEEEDK